jgi:DNA (cytosine-5)-methyltransferase 1
MPEQITLALWPREHDLPPRWDGLPVEWGEWSEIGLICPPPPRRPQCRCGSRRDPLINLGRIWTEPGTVLAIGRSRMNRGRHLVANIAAFRCPDCGRDHVLDGIGPDAQAWDLDETDYTDDGSWDVSSAGMRNGMITGSRSGLWAEFARAILELQPSTVVIENVRGLLSAKSTLPGVKAIDVVLNDLSDLGYGSRRMVLSASSIGAPHRRDRVFIVARSGVGHEVIDTKTTPPAGLLPTPAAADGSRGSKTYKRGNPTLRGAVLGSLAEIPLLPTPAVADGTGTRATRGGTRNNELLLNGIARRAVEQFGPPEWREYKPAIVRWANITRSEPYPVEIGKTGKPRLSPAFSEWMMGWPEGHVTGFDLSRPAALRLIGNGVVTHQAEAALKTLGSQ